LDSAKEKPSQGEITAVGPGGRDESGKLIPIDLKVGDRVLFGKWSGTEVVLDGEDLLMMKESDVVGVLTDVPVQRRRPLKPLVCTCRGSILLLAGAGAAWLAWRRS
jgi:chaperonin GroES